MSKPILVASLLLASLIAVPASANWFSNPNININLNLGSAPNPTPDQVLSEALPMLVRDADGNVIAMIEPGSGKIIATVEPAPPAKPGAVAAPRSRVNPSTR